MRLFKFILFFGALFCCSNSWATHARGGEITYKYLGNRYKFTITLCNDENGSQAAIDVNPIDIVVTADNLKGEAFRVAKNFTVGNFQETVFEFYSDQFIDDNGTPNDPSDDKTVALSNGTYLINVTILDRNAGIVNINGGDSEIPICLETLLVAGDAFTGGFNNSVYFENDICPELACAGVPYCFNPLAVDPDGDSLVYSFVIPKGEDCFPVSTYTMPNVIGGGNISIDSRTGTICWDSPQLAGDFVFGIKVEEYRSGSLVGYVRRDIQLTIAGNCSNLPPVLEPIPDTCVVAGESFSLPISATDPDGNTVFLTATGLPFESGPPLNLNPPATFTITSQGPTSTGIFSWDTNCSHIPNSPYNYVVTVEAADLSASVPLSNYQTFYIRVIPPHIKNVTATALGEDATITWSAAECPGNFLAYKVYRYAGGPPPSESCCEPEAALGLGYKLIATIYNPNQLSYKDENLQIGVEYCYAVTVVYAGGVESCPIEYDCVEIKKDVPVITHVTVNSTGGTGVGIDSIQWSRPTDLDLAVFPGPYFYRLYFDSGDNNPNTLIYTTPQANTLPELDTTHVFTTDTESTTNSYRVELWWLNSGAEKLIGTSKYATSIYLSTTPNDNEITLSWEENVPWENYLFDIYRADNFSGPFVFIGSTASHKYTDKGLINGHEYCYKVLGYGQYDMTSVIRPLFNWSQIKCDTPIDLTAPCPPELSINSDCEGEGKNYLTWTNPNNYCADDVTHYNIYFAPVEGDTLKLIASINSGDDSNAKDTTYVHWLENSVAGCYAITALDSLKYNNESVFSNVVCIDNCPLYELPNVFTPDGVEGNNIFHPIYPYRNVESVDFNVYNRWGQVIFYTTAPELGWDGTHKDNGKPVPEGTYYFVCEVNFIRLAGIIARDPAITGSITIFRGK